MNPAQGVELPSQIAFKSADMVERHLALAHNNLRNLASDLNMDPLHFKTFGKGFIKRQKCSPDSFLQIAFQAAYYLVHGKPAGHYESGGLRIFKVFIFTYIRERDLILGLSSMLSCRETHLGDFRRAVEESLITTHDLFVKHGQTSNL